MGLLVYS